jgi:hypothetical protein
VLRFGLIAAQLFPRRLLLDSQLVPVAAAIAGLRLGFSAQNRHALQGHQTAPHIPMRGFLDRPMPESVIKRIRRKFAK